MSWTEQNRNMHDPEARSCPRSLTQSIGCGRSEPRMACPDWLYSVGIASFKSGEYGNRFTKAGRVIPRRRRASNRSIIVLAVSTTPTSAGNTVKHFPETLQRHACLAETASDNPDASPSCTSHCRCCSTAGQSASSASKRPDGVKRTRTRPPHISHHHGARKPGHQPASPPVPDQTRLPLEIAIPVAEQITSATPCPRL